MQVSEHPLTKLADLHAATCFLNSLLREWHDYVIYRSEDYLAVSIQVTDHEAIHIPLLTYSMLGRHEYVGEFYLKKDNGYTELDFNDFLDYMSIKLSATEPVAMDLVPFKANVVASRDTIHQALQVHAATNLAPPTFQHSEQALVIGHHFHPIPKSRDKLTTAELLTYAPECKGEFPLQWLFVDTEILLHHQANHIDDKNWLNTLFAQDYWGHIVEIPDAKLPVPMHPWQWQHLQQDASIIAYLKNQQIIPLDQASPPWAATSSLRTVYRNHCSYMLKFSMNLKLTNSVRVLLRSEVERGVLLHDVLATEKGKQFCREFPHFHIITEPAYLCLMDQQGHPMENTMLVCRQNPFNGDEAKNTWMLASLIQDHPFGDTNVLLKIIQDSSTHSLSMPQRLKKWFGDYLQVAIQPLLMAYAKYGIIMEGHPQNMLLALEEGFPVAAYFRDCQDHAYSQHGYQLFSDSVPGIKQHSHSVADKEIGCHYFIYQVILNATFNVITTLAKSQSIHEQELLSDLYELLQTVKTQAIHDPYCLDILLSNKTLLHKRNFQFALTRINDNQLPCHPLDMYTSVPNMILPAIHQIAAQPSSLLYQRYLTGTQKTITLQLFDLTQHLELFIRWQTNPRVATYWQLDKSRQEVRDYLEEILAKPQHQAIIIAINDEPIGYAEVYSVNHDSIAHYYDHHPTDRGFHLLIGEDAFLGVKNTTPVFKAIMDYIYLSDSATQRIIVEPDKHNHRFIKYMQLIPGWQFINDVNLPDKQAALFIAYRQDFRWEHTS